ncbi:11316_t:CDS:2 [Funneliformis mosseae]|uniref:11316_t:CDS:1 n=1 Tax=Funneliformis mosseae TaxID=27381 RepID=A0A9N8VAE7_FUNMO|nr:11316_t:CDS:2 [Funneliformis mosseae]
MCSHCKYPNTGSGYAWCRKCDPGRFIKEGKTSGNPKMDDLIKKIHELNYVHGDLHSGNVLIFNDRSKITDLGLARSTTDKSNSNVSGVLPYMAPEIIDKKPYTTSSDVYSFGIIMTEISTGTISYEKNHFSLALAIINGLRPIIAEGTPDCYVDTVKKCLDANPKNRPSAKDLSKIIKKWRKESVQEFNNADNADSADTKTTLHPLASCTFGVSRQRRNITNFTGLQVEVPNANANKCKNLIIHRYDKVKNNQYGICPDCKKSNTGEAWCGKCDPVSNEKKSRSNPITVVLKKIKGSNNMSEILINEEFINADTIGPRYSSGMTLHPQAYYTSRSLRIPNFSKSKNFLEVQFEITKVLRRNEDQQQNPFNICGLEMLAIYNEQIYQGPQYIITWLSWKDWNQEMLLNNWCPQQDNDPKHTKRLAKEFLLEMSDLKIYGRSLRGNATSKWFWDLESVTKGEFSGYY